ncbi:ATPase AAA [Bifidobacterium margollesii]|uniref:ATPase AAA n=1 Tax=Bifidobacterium margollesii TaxID=2020964 RepID=A0A2N5JCB8_9BIFI|nr:ATP-binding protein [Bifidobacterium margollesii]PLS31856.1 ATPase AAA [Bifidobacterium margollesii]
MTDDEFIQVIQSGESSVVEFKRCGDMPHPDTFETVCSFANRSGGDIYLGVDDDGEVTGVDASRAVEIERNIVNVTSNRKLFIPAPMVETERIMHQGKTVIRV